MNPSPKRGWKSYRSDFFSFFPKNFFKWFNTVKSGDTLWGIAKKELGSGARYTEIVQLNGLKTSTIYSGQKLKLPEK